MSRIVLTTMLGGHAERVVIGWDHPARGAFWQEWANPEEIDAAERKVTEWEDNPTEGDEHYTWERIAETGVKRDGGMFPGIPIDELRDQMPEDLRPLITDEVLALLREHAADPNSGRITMSVAL